MRAYSYFLLPLGPDSGITQNSSDSLYFGITKKFGKTFVISRMHMILKPQNYNCLTVTTLIYLGHLLKVREIPGVSGINVDLKFKSNLNIAMIPYPLCSKIGFPSSYPVLTFDPKNNI